MVLSRTKESQIHDLILAGFSQREIARKVEICLATVNQRIQLYKATGSTKLLTSKRYSKYNPIQEMTKQRIRSYLALETRKSKFTTDQLHEKLPKDGYKVKKSKAKEWIRLERNRLKES